jgi:hypothetical protein
MQLFQTLLIFILQKKNNNQTELNYIELFLKNLLKKNEKE